MFVCQHAFIILATTEGVPYGMGIQRPALDISRSRKCVGYLKTALYIRVCIDICNFVQHCVNYENYVIRFTYGLARAIVHIIICSHNHESSSSNSCSMHGITAHSSQTSVYTECLSSCRVIMEFLS